MKLPWINVSGYLMVGSFSVRIRRSQVEKYLFPMYSAIKTKTTKTLSQIHFENGGQYVGLHGIQWFDTDQRMMWCICAQGLTLTASNTSPTLKGLATHRNGHGGGSWDAGTAQRIADGKFMTDGEAELKVVNCGERLDEPGLALREENQRRACYAFQHKL